MDDPTWNASERASGKCGRRLRVEQVFWCLGGGRDPYAASQEL